MSIVGGTDVFFQRRRGARRHSAADRHKVAGGGKNRAGQRQPIRLGELGSERFITVKPGYGLRQITDALFASAGLEPEITFESEEVETARGFVAAGLGIALLPARIAGTRDETVELDLVPAVNRTVGLVWSAARPLRQSGGVSYSDR